MSSAPPQNPALDLPFAHHEIRAKCAPLSHLRTLRTWFAKQLEAGPLVIQVREATADDYDLLLPLFLDLRRFSRQRHPPQHDDFDKVLAASQSYLQEILAREENAATFLATTTNDDAIAGYLIAVVNEPNPLTSSGAVRIGSIDELYVDADCRGTGAGNALMSAAEAWFSQHGAERLEVGAYAWNEEAIAFYERHGFAPTSVTLSKPVGGAQAE